MRRAVRTLAVCGLAVILSILAAPWASGQVEKQNFDISCNGASIRFDGPTQTHDGEEHPDYGASFVVQGYIYPEGTFAARGADRGVRPDGRPEFPELVIGRWYCRGWFVGAQGIFTESGPLVVTTQIYDLKPGSPGTHTLTSDGIELADFNVPFRRAVTGGSGALSGASGEVVQTVVGLNGTGLFNFTFNFDNVVIGE